MSAIDRDRTRNGRGRPVRDRPAYLEGLMPSGLEDRASRLGELMRECVLCPHECRARRLEGRYGVCRSAADPIVSSVSPHFGEEAPLVGLRGSGTIFFTSCTLKCQYCQNHDISQDRIGRRVSVEGLAESMLWLQDRGCHNINLVTPTHWTPLIVKALVIAAVRGLSLPIVYNCSGYESVGTLRLLDGIIDIYMPDIKYSDDVTATRLSGAPGYWNIVRQAVQEMHRQVGNLVLDALGIARRGILIRHLVLPNGLAGSRKVLNFIARDVSIDSYVNIMDQYRPAFHAYRHPLLNRSITAREYDDVTSHAARLGLHRGFPPFDS